MRKATGKVESFESNVLKLQSDKIPIPYTANKVRTLKKTKKK